MSELNDLNRIDELTRQVVDLRQQLANVTHENTMLKAHFAMFTRRLADSEHDKRVTDRRKLAYAMPNERRGGFDRRQMASGLKR